MAIPGLPAGTNIVHRETEAAKALAPPPVFLPPIEVIVSA